MHSTSPELKQTKLHPPFLQRLPFFYGWLILAAATLGMIMTSPGQTYVVSIFIEHFINDLGLNRSIVSTLYTIATLVGSFSLTFIGKKIDIHGPRRMVVLISLGLGLACFIMAAAYNPIVLCIGFIFIRMFGLGGLWLVSRNVVNLWWVRRRGFVLGIADMATALFGIGVIPSVVQWLIHTDGWRYAYSMLGLTALILMLPIGHLFFRDHPEKYGLLPDGISILPKPNDSLAKPQHEENWTLQDARRTLTFWISALGNAAIAMLTTGLYFHMVSMISDQGLSGDIVARIFVPVAITTAIMNLIVGYIIDRLQPKYFLGIALLFQASSMLFLPIIASEGMAFFFGILMGMTRGISHPVGGVIWPFYFGRKHLGAISGQAQTIFIVGAALGPLPLGIAHDMFGRYDAALFILAIIPITLAITSFFMREPTLYSHD